MERRVPLQNHTGKGERRVMNITRGSAQERIIFKYARQVPGSGCRPGILATLEGEAGNKKARAVWFTERGQGYPEQNCETLFQMKSKTISAIGLHNRAFA